MRQKLLLCLASVVAAIAPAALGPGCAIEPTTMEGRLLQELFPGGGNVREIAPRPGWPLERQVFVIRGPSGDVGYAVREQVVSRSGPFVILVIIDSQSHVRRAEVLFYTAERGADVQMYKFTQQFEGKGPADAIRVGKDIDAITGATLSARAMSGGVREAIRVVQKLTAPQP